MFSYKQKGQFIMIKKYSLKAIITISLLSLNFAVANAGQPYQPPKVDSNKILSVKFAPRQIVQIESGKFHFKPWQIGPIHTHPALCLGYVVKGDVIYQVEGEKPQMLNTGVAFYEPTGPRIMRFDNASATGETIFIDFCPQQKGEPFLLFEKEPTEFIDRRALSTMTLEKPKTFDRVDVFEHLILADGRKNLDNRKSLIAGYVVNGEIELRTNDKKSQRIKAGENFYLPASRFQTLLVNFSSKTPAKVITFNLQ